MIGVWLGADAIGRVWALDGFRMKGWRSASASVWAATLEEHDEDYDGFFGSVQLTLTRDVDESSGTDGSGQGEVR